MRATARILVDLALRNLVSHWLKSVVVGGLIFFGTFLVVVGTAMLDTIEATMTKSITSSLAGQLQVYSKKARDPLALFGGMFMGSEDIGRMNDFDAVRAVAEKVPNVEAVVPMGLDLASVTGGNEIDRLADRLRAAWKEGDRAQLEVVRQQILTIAQQFRTELETSLPISSNKDEIAGQIADVDKLSTPEFWAGLDTDAEQVFQFVESKIAPLSSEGLLIYLRYLGTDVDKFTKNFDRFAIVKGEAIPSGRRGFLFNDKFYEDQIKHKVARDLDRLHREKVENGKSIAADPALKSIASQLARLQRRITFQLEPAERVQLRDALVRALPPEQVAAVAKDASGQPELEGLVTELLKVDDENIVARHALFYRVVAPLVELYQVKLGEMMTIRAFTRSGTLKSVNVKVWGTFKFTGLEKSDIAGGHNVVDMMTFRDLYDLMTEAKRKEAEAIRAGVALKDVERGDAEAELFGGGGAQLEVRADDGAGFDEFQGKLIESERTKLEAQLEQAFDQGAIDRGVALNAAIVLRDPAALRASQAALQKAFDDAGLDLQVVDWQQASGIVGQFVVLVRGVLFIAIFIIFLVALVIINNTMVMATMDRVTEIGTLRAIGAQRGFVMAMFFAETLALGILAGALGALAGAGFVTWLGSIGLSANNQDILIFLFGGPRLFPVVSLGNLVFAFVVVVIVSVASTLYPARLATRIQPVVAMQAKE